jgi:hypothetical protein
MTRREKVISAAERDLAAYADKMEDAIRTFAPTNKIKSLYDPVGNALELLLSQEQIAFIKTKTFAGPSRKQVLRRLVTLGIKAEKNPPR